MSEARSSHGLPFLPGFTFRDVTKSAFHRPQALVYRNGYAVPRPCTVGIGQDRLLSLQLMQQEVDEVSSETPEVTFGSLDRSVVESFIPAYVSLDKKVLRYYAYFQEMDEDRCVRPVVIYYYLEDDSMSVFEPMVENSGLTQGKRIKRQRLSKKEHGELLHWKELNVGTDLEVFGVTYHITHCDAFTKAFMESQGIVVNDPEPMPVASHSKRHKSPPPSHTPPPKHQLLSMDGKVKETRRSPDSSSTVLGQVLRFSALWDDDDFLFGDPRPVTIQYYLGDDTVDIREVHEGHNSRDVFLMRRQKLPRKMKPDVEEHYCPKDFQLGGTVTLLGRRFLLCDCDAFTKDYFQEKHPGLEMKPFEVLQQRRRDVPPYNGFGSLEDSLQNCLSLVPRRPRKNVLKMLENDHKVLRYTGRLDSMNPGDEGRRFVLSYFLSDDMMSIYETPNSGIIGGQFLRKTRVPKPGSTVDQPDFYSPADFAIGATLEVFGSRFVLTGADHYVLKYLESNATHIPALTLDSLRQKLGVETADVQPADQKKSP